LDSTTFKKTLCIFIVNMGFIRSTIDHVNGKYVATLFISWYYFWSDSISKTFDDIQDAKDWILQERCYNNLEITEDARGKMSYADALKLGAMSGKSVAAPINNSNNSNNSNKNKKKKNTPKC
jgi:hypothetical protein